MIGGIPLMLPEGLLAGASAAATASASATFAAQAANVGYQAYNMSLVSKLSQQSWLQVAGDGVVDATGKPAWASSSGGGPMISLSYGIPKTRLGLALTLAAGDQGYYLSVGTGEISGFSLVAGWNFSEPSAGWTTEATIAGGTGFVGGTYSVVNDMTANNFAVSSTIGAGWGVGFSKGFTTTMTWNLYPMPAPSLIPNINPNAAFAPDMLRLGR